MKEKQNSAFKNFSSAIASCALVLGISVFAGADVSRASGETMARLAPPATMTATETNGDNSTFRIGSAGVTPGVNRGDPIVVDIQLDSNGAEIATGFSIQYDPAVLTFGSAVIGPDAQAKGFALTLNQTKLGNGQLGAVLFNFSLGTFSVAPPSSVVVRLNFTVKGTAPFGVSPIRFIGNGCPNDPGNAPTDCSTAGVNGQGDPVTINPVYTDGAIAVLAPVTNASITGKVTSPGGLGQGNLVVTMADSAGNRRTVRTNSFGTYTFSSVVTNDTYTISVTSKKYRFQPRSVLLTGNLAGFDFTGIE